jgi:hypothetical protein
MVFIANSWSFNMAKMQVFDPAMCCSTGVCGPSVDPTLPQFAADLEWLKDKGVEVERFNLSQQVAAFTQNPKVKQALNSQGTQVLPMVLVDGEVKASGGYPGRSDLARFAGVEFEPTIVQNQELVGITLKGK